MPVGVLAAARVWASVRAERAAYMRTADGGRAANVCRAACSLRGGWDVGRFRLRHHSTHAPNLTSTSSTSSCRSPHGVTQVVLKGVEDADDDGSSAALVILHGAAGLRFRVQGSV
jgi:hypothetical protein